MRRKGRLEREGRLDEATRRMMGVRREGGGGGWWWQVMQAGARMGGERDRSGSGGPGPLLDSGIKGEVIVGEAEVE
jgi:hypothetical protein